MKILFKPIDSLNNLKYGQKFTLIGIIVLALCNIVSSCIRNQRWD